MNTPPGWQPPVFYLTATAEDVALALELGASAVKHMKEKAIDTVRRQTHSDITESYEGRIKKLQKEYESERVDLVAELERLEKDGAKRREAARTEIREGMRDLIEAKEAQIRSLEASLQGLGGKFETLQSNLTRVYTSSKEKGTVGEAIVESMIKKAYDCDVEVVSKESQTADIRMTRPGGTYFWEVKNYTRMVSKEEVEKFRRDLRLHPGIRGGILVSLRTGIVGKTRGGDIDVEFLEDGRAVLFLSNLFARDDIVFYLQTLRPFLDCLERLAAPVGPQGPAPEPADLAALQQKAVLVTTLMRNHAANVVKHQNSIVNHRKRTESMFTEFQAFLLEAETQINTVLRLVMSDDATDTAAITFAAGVDLPLAVFAKTALTDYTDKEREFVTWFLETAEIRAGSDVQVKELLERAVSHKKSWNEKFVRGMRGVFQEGVWAHGARSLHGLGWLKI